MDGLSICRAALNLSAAELWAGAEPWQIGAALTAGALAFLLAGAWLARWARFR